MASLAELKETLVAAHQAGDEASVAKLVEAIELKEKQAGADRAVVSGVTQGLVGSSVGLPGDLREMVAETGAYDRVPFILRPPKFPTTKDITRTAQDDTGLPLAYDPQTANEKYLHSISSGAVGMALPMGKIPLAFRTAAGAFGGFAGEAARQVSDSGAVGAGAQTLATVLPLMLAARKPQVVRALQKDLEGLGMTEPKGSGPFRPTDQEMVPEALRRAEKRAGDVEAHTGVRPALSQTTEQPTSLSGIMEEVAMSPSGRKLDAVLHKETAAGHKMIADSIRSASPLESSQETANRILRAGNKALERPGKVASAVSKRDYRRAGQDVLPVERGYMPPEDNPFSRFGAPVSEAVEQSARPRHYTVPKTTAEELQKAIRGRIKELHLEATPASAALEAEIGKIAKLADMYPGGIPVLSLDAQRRWLEGKVQLINEKRTLGSDDILSKNAYQAAAGLIDDAIKDASESLSAGKGKFSRTVRTAGKRMEESPMPDLFPPEARATGRGDFDVMGKIITDSARYSPDDIRYVAQNMKRADPQAFPALVKQSWEAAWNDASKVSRGRTPQEAMNDWVRQVAGHSGSKARLNLEETTRQMALARGMHPSEAEALVKGTNATMDALLVFSRDRGGLSAVHGNELRKAAGGNEASAMAYSFSLAPMFSVGRAWERAVWHRTFEQIADAMTTPGGAQKLIAISQFSQPQRAAEAFVRSLVGASAGAEQNSPEEMPQ